MRELQEPEYNQVWDAFEKRFNFRPGVNGPFPGIDEPSPSVTFSLPRESDDSVDELVELIIETLRGCTPQGEEVYYLDWQHSCFAFTPSDGINHRCSPYPDGDYAILLAKDLSYGSFGHPWEPTICCFGEALVGKLLATLRPEILRRRIRSKLN